MSVRAFVLSDIHIGDPKGLALASGDSFEPLRIRKEFLAFLDRVEAMPPQPHKPMLVLAGDVWDVAIDNIDEIATLSWRVFDALKPRLGAFESILFLPGNHDHALWTLLQTQTCIIRPLDERAQGRDAKVHPLPHAQEALLDFTKGPHPELEIPGVRPPYTGNVFLTGFTGGNIAVNVSYPNLAVRRSDGSNLVVTHGHFFEQAWTLLSDLFLPSMGGQLPPGRDLASLEMLNASLTDFINYSLAQVGPLNHVIQGIYEDFRLGREPPQLRSVIAALRTVLDRAAGSRDPFTPLERFKEAATDLLIDFELFLLKIILRTSLANARSETILPSGRLPGILDDQDKVDKIEAYLEAVRRDRSIPTDSVSEVVFGHTHESIRGRVLSFGDGGSVTFWNPGSLVAPDGSDPDFLPLAIDHEGRVAPF